LFEWARVARPGGILYLVVPDRRHTFDHTRNLTPARHMIEDFDRHTTSSDPTHIGDYLDGIDWNLWNPSATPEQNASTREELRRAYRAAVAAGQEINIHFHVFEPSNLLELIRLMNQRPDRPATLEPVDLAEGFPATCPNGFLLVLKVNKGWRSRLAARWLRLRARGNAHAALSPGAKPLRVNDPPPK
jgi:hypothetical protein